MMVQREKVTTWISLVILFITITIGVITGLGALVYNNLETRVCATEKGLADNKDTISKNYIEIIGPIKENLVKINVMLEYFQKSLTENNIKLNIILGQQKYSSKENMENSERKK